LLHEHKSFTSFSTSTALVSVFQTAELTNKGQNEGYVDTRVWCVSRCDRSELGNGEQKKSKNLAQNTYAGRIINSPCKTSSTCSSAAPHIPGKFGLRLELSRGLLLLQLCLNRKAGIHEASQVS